MRPHRWQPTRLPVPGILQAKTLEWVAISFSNAWKWKVKGNSLSHVRLLATPWLQLTRLLRPWDFPGKNTGVGCHCLLHYCLYHLPIYLKLSASVQFSYSVMADSLQPHDCSTPAFPVHHKLPAFAQTHVQGHQVSDAIQPSHPLSSPSLTAFYLSQHQGLFNWVSSLHQVAKGLEFQLQHQSLQWIIRTDFL